MGEFNEQTLRRLWVGEKRRVLADYLQVPERYGNPGWAYGMSLNLAHELSELVKAVNENPVIWDVGCGSGVGIRDLQAMITGRKLQAGFMATDAIDFPDSARTVPRVITYTEMLDSTNVKKFAIRHNVYPPNVLLARNSLKTSLKHGTLDIAARAMTRVLVPGGRVLVYEDSGVFDDIRYPGHSLYDIYVRAFERIPGTRVTMQESDNNWVGECKRYIRVEKGN